MIDSGLVTDAVLTVLAATDVPVGDMRVPDATADGYAILEHPPGPLVDDGDLGDRHRHLVYRGRICSVGGDRSAPANRKGARAQAEWVAGRMRSALIDPTSPISGDGWIVTARKLTATAMDGEGTIVNVYDDFELLVVPGPASPPGP